MGKYSLVLTGYFMGKYIPGTKDYLGYIVIFLIVITSIPFIYNSIKKKLGKHLVKSDKKSSNT